MPFRIFNDPGFTFGEPGRFGPPTTYFLPLGIEWMPTPFNAYPAIEGNGNPTYTINYSNIQTQADLVVASGGSHLVWDIENYDGNTILVDQRYHTNTQIDATLDMLEDVYNATKSYQPSLQVSFYGFPTCVDMETYYSIFGYYNPGTPYYIDYYNNTFLPAIRRLNKRWNGSSYDDYPLSNYMDFWTPSIYPRYFGASGMLEWNIYSSGLLKVVKEEFADLPIYAYLTHNPAGGPWVGKVPTTAEMREMLEFVYAHCDGLMMWGGYAASDDFTYIGFKPDGTKTISDWNAVNSGVLRISMDGVEIEVTGLNFTTATGYNQIANIVATGVNNYITSAIDPIVPTIITPISYNYPSCFPFHIGNVTFTYTTGSLVVVPTGAHFKFKSDGGQYKTPSGTVSPPESKEYKFGLVVNWLTPSNSGTNIGVAAYLGSRIDPEQTRCCRNSNEFENGWAVGTDWYEEFLRFAAEVLFVVRTCYPMWPTTMWPTSEWVDTEWPICSEVSFEAGCRIDFDPTDLISTMNFMTALDTYTSGRLDLYSSLVINNVNFAGYASGVLDLYTYKEQPINFISTASGNININETTQLGINLAEYASGSINLNSYTSGSINLISNASGSINMLGVYNIPTAFCPICGLYSCNCGS